MPNVTGVVEKKFEDALFVGGIRYGGKFKKAEVAKANVGDTVTISFKQNGEWYNIVKVNVDAANTAPQPSSSPVGAKTYRNGSFPIDPLDGQRSIIRQNALTNARSLVERAIAENTVLANSKQVADIILHYAREFEAYTAGDLDREAAESKLEVEE